MDNTPVNVGGYDSVIVEQQYFARKKNEQQYYFDGMPLPYHLLCYKNGHKCILKD